MVFISGIIASSIQTTTSLRVESTGDYSSFSYSLCSFSAPIGEIPFYWFKFIENEDYITTSYSLCSFSVPEGEIPGNFGYYFLSGEDFLSNSYSLCSFSTPEGELSAQNWGYYFLSGADFITNSYSLCSFEVLDSELLLMYPFNSTIITPFRTSIYGVSSDARTALGLSASYERFAFSYWETTSNGTSYTIVPNYQSPFFPYAFLSGGATAYDASLNSLSARLTVGYKGQSYRSSLVALKPYSSILDIPNLQIWLDASDSSTTLITQTTAKNVFKDSSSNNFTITKTGNPTQGTFSPFSPNGAVYNPATHGGSAYFDGSSRLLAFSNDAFSFGTSDYTIETWVNTTSVSDGYGMIFSLQSGANWYWGIRKIGNTLYLTSYDSSNILEQSSGVNISMSQWSHIAWSRSGTTFRAFVDGNLVYTGTSSQNAVATGVYIGHSNNYVGYYFNGYLSNARIVKGTALYTSNFTPSTSPLTNVANTSLLLNFTNGFCLDSAAKNDLVLNGDATIVNSVKKYGIGSLYFDGSGDYIVAPAKPEYNFATDDFTIECWVKFNNTSTGYDGIIDSGSSLGGATSSQWYLYRNLTNLYFGRHAVANLLAYNTSSMVPGVWYHLAVTRQAGNINLFVDGVRVATTFYPGWSIDGSNIRIGAIATPYYMNGYIDDVRITKGIARYGPQVALLLNGNGTNGGNNNSITDSSNNFTIIRNGTPTQSSLTPFTSGGSVYFDGINSYLTFPANSAPLQFGTGDFTAESWIYLNQNISRDVQIPIWGDVKWVASYWQSGWVVIIDGTNRSLKILQGGLGFNQWDAVNTTDSLPLNSWIHIAVSRSAGVVNLFVNGALKATKANTYNYTNSESFKVGAWWVDGINNAGYTSSNFYVSNLRIVKGTALYTSNFTVPTSPLTNISGTSLLLNTPPSVIDSANKNPVIYTNGNSAITTSVKKYGSGSLYFDGSGDYLQILGSNNFAFGTGNFTIEGWVNPIDINASNKCFVNIVTPPGAYFYLGQYADYFICYIGNNLILLSSNFFSANTWTHFALVRNGTSLKLYKDGNEVSSTTNGSNLSDSSTPLTIGGINGGNYFNGYIDDLRIIKGAAMYTSNFTPPALELTTDTTSITALSSFTPPLTSFPNSTSGDSDFNSVSLLVQADELSDEARWLDKSPQGNNAFQTVGTYVPTLSVNSIGTRQALAFDGADFLNLGTPISLSSTNATTFFVYNRQASGDFNLSLGNKSATDITTGLQWNDDRVYAFNGYSYPKPNLGPSFIGVTKNSNALYMSGLARDCCLLTLQNNTLVDNSGKGAAFTTTGTLTVSSVSISGTNTSGWYFNGSSYTTTPNTGTFNFTTYNSTSASNVTIECWIYLMGSGGRGIVGARGNGQGNGWCIYIDGNNYLRVASAFDGEGYSDNILQTPTISNNAWVHIAVVKNNNGCTGYVNGVAGTTLSKTTGFNYQSTQPVVVGALASQGEGPFNGYISNLRIVRGALYNSNFTVPTPPLATVSTFRGAVDQPDYAANWNTSSNVFVDSVGTYGSYRHKGAMGEIVYANCTLPDAELELVGNSLRTKWGIT